MHLPTPQDLRERRKALDLTQEEVAHRAGVSQPLIARIEGGDVDPRLSTLRRIVEALDEAEGDVVRARELMNVEVVSVEPDDALKTAGDIMLEAGYSQLPVIRGDDPKGIITNAHIIEHRSDGDVGSIPVADAMDSSFSTREPDATLDEIERALEVSPAVIVVEDGRILGIITEADVAAYVS